MVKYVDFCGFFSGICFCEKENQERAGERRIYFFICLLYHTRGNPNVKGKKNISRARSHICKSDRGSRLIYRKTVSGTMKLEK